MYGTCGCFKCLHWCRAALMLLRCVNLVVFAVSVTYQIYPDPRHCHWGRPKGMCSLFLVNTEPIQYHRCQINMRVKNVIVFFLFWKKIPGLNVSLTRLCSSPVISTKFYWSHINQGADVTVIKLNLSSVTALSKSISWRIMGPSETGHKVGEFTPRWDDKSTTGHYSYTHSQTYWH